MLDLEPEDVKQYASQICIILTYLTRCCRTFDVNVLSQFWTIKAFLPEMIKQKTGHIVCREISNMSIHLTSEC